MMCRVFGFVSTCRTKARSLAELFAPPAFLTWPVFRDLCEGLWLGNPAEREVSRADSRPFE